MPRGTAAADALDLRGQTSSTNKSRTVDGRRPSRYAVIRTGSGRRRHRLPSQACVSTDPEATGIENDIRVGGAHEATCVRKSSPTPAPVKGDVGTPLDYIRM